ncbi:MAG: F0F1 ATP synthase subunit A [Erysipelotrichaceae bacterium]|nr:F0F1 ATP synthase subunit A [Erysipelotrichaceae bacterium]
MFDNLFGIQPAVVYIALISIVIAVFLIIVNISLKKYDPLSKPKGLVLLVMMFAEMIDSLVKEKTNERVAKFLTPYIMTVAVYIFLSNIAGLFAIECPTSNFSVTLVLALITCTMIEVFSIRERGLGGYIKTWMTPMSIVNIISKISTLLSLSLRLFGNILSGTVLMSVIYQLLNSISSMIPLIGEKFNIIGVMVAPVLHAYFDIFSGFMQAFIFVMLSVSFIGNELPKKEEN